MDKKAKGERDEDIMAEIIVTLLEKMNHLFLDPKIVVPSLSKRDLAELHRIIF